LTLAYKARKTRATMARPKRLAQSLSPALVVWVAGPLVPAPEEPVELVELQESVEPVELEEPFEPDGALKYGQINAKLNKKKGNPRNSCWFSTWVRSCSSVVSQLHVGYETM